MYVLFAFSLNRNTNKKCENLVIAPKRKFQMVLHNHVTCWFRVIMLQQHRLYNRNLHQLLPSCITRSEWQHYSWLFVYIPVEIRFPFTFLFVFRINQKCVFVFQMAIETKQKIWFYTIEEKKLDAIVLFSFVCVVLFVSSCPDSSRNPHADQKAMREKNERKKEGEWWNCTYYTMTLLL